MSNQQFTITSPEAQFMIEEYASWHAQILERIFYSSDMTSAIAPQPSSFLTWAEDREKDGFAQNSFIQGLIQIHHDFIAQGHTCLASMGNRQVQPDYKDYKKLNILLVELLKHIGSMSFSGGGDARYVDDQTGLHTRQALERDLQGELERLKRHGKPFTLALIKMNEYETLESELPPPEFSACLKLLAGVIEKSIRSFDDAYYLGEGRFAVCLKQSEKDEGIRALARLRTSLQDKGMIYRVRQGLVVLSVSSCITEPMPGDELGVLLSDLEQEIKNYAGDTAAVIEHQQISPLQRYLKDSPAT